jgi:hypothetical protein
MENLQEQISRIKSIMGILTEQGIGRRLADALQNADSAIIKSIKNIDPKIATNFLETEISTFDDLFKHFNDFKVIWKSAGVDWILINESLSFLKNAEKSGFIKQIPEDEMLQFINDLPTEGDLRGIVFDLWYESKGLPVKSKKTDIKTKIEKNDNGENIVIKTKTDGTEETFNITDSGDLIEIKTKESELPKSFGVLELENYLKQNGIPVEVWGKDYAKTVEHLLWEIQSKECNLIKEGGILIREIEFVMSEIFYKKGNETFKLIEEKQIFVDGRERVRQKDSSVSEKIKIGEDPHESLKRGIEEELGLDLTDSQIETKGVFNEEEVSNSFPGLTTRYKGNKFTCYLDDTQYNPNGYKEVQKDKTTYFSWIKI